MTVGARLMLGTVLVAWAIAARLIYLHWRSDEARWYKIFVTAVTLIPIFGPLLHFFFRVPPSAPLHLQQVRRNYYGQSVPLGPPAEPPHEDPDSKLAIPARARPRIVEQVTLAIGAGLLAIYWSTAIEAIRNADPWAYTNPFGLRVGTVLLTIVLAVASLAWLIGAWRFWFSPMLEWFGRKSLRSSYALERSEPGPSRGLKGADQVPRRARSGGQRGR